MRREFIVLAGGLMVVVLSVLLFTSKSQDVDKSLILRNVEALANGENDNDKPKQTAVKSNDECVIGTDMPYASLVGRWYNCQDDTNGIRNCQRYCGANK